MTIPNIATFDQTCLVTPSLNGPGLWWALNEWYGGAGSKLNSPASNQEPWSQLCWSSIATPRAVLARASATLPCIRQSQIPQRIQLDRTIDGKFWTLDLCSSHPLAVIVFTATPGCDAESSQSCWRCCSILLLTLTHSPKLSQYSNHFMMEIFYLLAFSCS